MSELEVGPNNEFLQQVLDKAHLDVVRNGVTKSVPVKQLLHGVHDNNTTVNQALEKPAAPKAKPNTADVINPAMSVSSFRTSEKARLKQRAKFERQQQKYLNQGGAPSSTDYW